MVWGKVVMAKNTILYEWVRPFLIPFLGALIGYLVLFSRLDGRVKSIEERNERIDPLVERFLQLEERDKKMVEEVSEIRRDVKELLKRSK